MCSLGFQLQAATPAVWFGRDHISASSTFLTWAFYPFFFFFNEGAVQLVFCSVFEEIAPCAAVDLLFLREQVNSD